MVLSSPLLVPVTSPQKEQRHRGERKAACTRARGAPFPHLHELSILAVILSTKAKGTRSWMATAKSVCSLGPFEGSRFPLLNNVL